MYHDPSGLRDLTARLRGEYLEMPGLALTFRQACRLFGLDAETCDVVLATLTEEGFLRCTPRGTYILTSLPARGAVRRQVTDPGEPPAAPPTRREMASEW